MIHAYPFLRTIERVTRIPPEILWSDKRGKAVARVRQAVMFVLRNKAKYPYTAIARYVGRKDHTTVIFGASAFERYLRKKEPLALRCYKIAIRAYVKHKQQEDQIAKDAALLVARVEEEIECQKNKPSPYDC